MRLWCLLLLCLLAGCGKGFRTGISGEAELGSAGGRPKIETGPVLFGVSLSGAELGTVLPGTHGTDYTYPSTTLLDYFKGKGLLLIRLPVRWERLQIALNGPLRDEELNRIRTFVAEAGERGMLVIVDLYNQGFYGGFQVGSAEVPNSAFKDFWRKLAAALKDEKALYGYALMSEPVQPASTWRLSAQAGVDGVRASDPLKKIFVSGGAQGRAEDWRMLNDEFQVTDPSGNVVYEATLFFDQDGTGNYDQSFEIEADDDQVGVDRLESFVDWLLEKGRKGMISRYAVPADDPRWNTALENALKHMQLNCIAGTYWSSGALSVAPESGDRPQISALQKYPGNANCAY